MSEQKITFMFGLLFVNCCFQMVLANYRQINVETHEICSTKSSILGAPTGGKITKIGNGAAIFTLKNPSKSFQPFYRDHKKCTIHIQAPKNHGLILYVEEMNFRVNKKDRTCVDVLKFGNNDQIPFITFKKSKDYCSYYNGKHNLSDGIIFNEPHGDLIVWLTLGQRRETKYHESISAVNLTFIVTSYKTKCDRSDMNYKKCGKSDRCIWKSYVCDGHFNCGTNQTIGGDEDDCPSISTIKPPNSLSENNMNQKSRLNLLSVTLIAVCVGIVIMLIFILAIRYLNNRRCLSSAEEQMIRNANNVHSIMELNEMRQSQNIYHSNVYGTRDDMILENTTSLINHTEDQPPAYDELFPENQQTTQQQEQVNSTIAPSSQTTQTQESQQTTSTNEENVNNTNS